MLFLSTKTKKAWTKASLAIITADPISVKQAGLNSSRTQTLIPLLFALFDIHHKSPVITQPKGYCGYIRNWLRNYRKDI